MTEFKGFLEVFRRYAPSERKRTLLSHAVGASYRYQKDPMRVEVELTFPSHEDFDTICEIEDDCRELYAAASFKILPHFPPESFTVERFSEITAEAALCGAVTNGFFNHAAFTDDGARITCSIPFGTLGVEFVNASATCEILSNILHSRYGVRREIVITSDARTAEFERDRARRRDELLRNAEAANIERRRAEAEAQRTKAEEEARAADPPMILSAAPAFLR